MKEIFFSLLLTLAGQNITAQNQNNSVKFSVAVDTSIIYGPFKAYESANDTVAQMFCEKIISFTYSIENISKSKINLPVKITCGESSAGYIISFEAERMTNNKIFIEIQPWASVPIFDDGGIVELLPGKKITGTGSVHYSAQIKEINRIKFTLNISRFNESIKNNTTDWKTVNYHEPNYPSQW